VKLVRAVDGCILIAKIEDGKGQDKDVYLFVTQPE
jgi:hypothetical protein